MARCRIIRPEFFTHGALYDAEEASGLPLRVAYAGLWCVADREGRFAWKPRELKLDILPFDAVDFEAVLMALREAGFIQRYGSAQGEAGAWYGLIPSFPRHQKPHHREVPSRIPAPSSEEAPDKARPHHNLGTDKARPSPTVTSNQYPVTSNQNAVAVTVEDPEVASLPRVPGPVGPDPAETWQEKKVRVSKELRALIPSSATAGYPEGVSRPSVPDA